jgi:hypothetical protein
MNSFRASMETNDIRSGISNSSCGQEISTVQLPQAALARAGVPVSAAKLLLED